MQARPRLTSGARALSDKATEEVRAGMGSPLLLQQVVAAVLELLEATLGKDRPASAGTAVMGFNLLLMEWPHTVPAAVAAVLITAVLQDSRLARAVLAEEAEARFGMGLGAWRAHQTREAVVVEVKVPQTAVRAAQVLQFSVTPSGLH